MTKEELEKENAELKEKLKPENCLKLLAKEGYIKFTSDQLVQAKKLIADIIKFQPYINRDTMFLTIGKDWKEVIFKAEQFVREVE